jgi:hypothetical protein
VVAIRQARTEVRKGRELEILIPTAPRDPTASWNVYSLRPRSPSNMPALRATQPPVRGLADRVERAAGASQPAVHHRRVAGDRPVQAGQRPGHPHHPDRVPFGAVGRLRPLPRRDSSAELEIDG